MQARLAWVSMVAQPVCVSAVALGGMRCCAVRMKLHVRVRLALVFAAVTTDAMVAAGGRLEVPAVPAAQAALLAADQAEASAATAAVMAAVLGCQVPFASCTPAWVLGSRKPGGGAAWLELPLGGLGGS